MNETTAQLYDRIGGGYGRHRRPDPRLAALILEALGDAETVVNVGAGAGSYEPTDRSVVAVEPSAAMIHQRHAAGAPVVQASASHLPFRKGSFDAGLAILTIHHWPGRTHSLAELMRVSRRRAVIVTWDPAAPDFWLTRDYFPVLSEVDRRIFPSMEELRASLGHIEVRPMPVPRDCTDGFLGAYWQRPSAYLDADVRGAISTFSRLTLTNVESGLARLHSDLEDGSWQRRYGHLAFEYEMDLGYRLVIANTDTIDFT